MKLKKPNTMARAVCAGAGLTLCCLVPVYATGSDPLTIVNNLSDFIFSIIKAIGIIILGWGIVQVGMSIQSHDASQRTQGPAVSVWWLAYYLRQGDPDADRRGVRYGQQLDH